MAGTPPETNISAAYPFESQFVTVRGSRLHYIEEGTGPPVLFLHGAPAWSYVWRNVIPHVSKTHRCVALDLLGFGKSDKPATDITWDEHAATFDAFVAQLGLRDYVIVGMDWGGAMGLYHASRHEASVKGLCFFETVLRPNEWKNLDAAFNVLGRALRGQVTGYLIGQVANVMINAFMRISQVRKLSAEEHAQYAAPWPTVASRRVIPAILREMPFDGKPASNAPKVVAYTDWLKATELPKLFFKATPGSFVGAEFAAFVEASFSNMRVVDLGQGVHFLQEDHPERMGKEIAAWLEDTVAVPAAACGPSKPKTSSTTAG